MSTFPAAVPHSRVRQAWEVTSDLLIATALIWTLPLLFGVLGAALKFINDAW